MNDELLLDFYEETIDDTPDYNIDYDMVSIRTIEQVQEEKIMPDFKSCISTASKGQTINYELLTKLYADYADIVTWHDVCYTPNGTVADAMIKKDFYHLLANAGWTSAFDKPVDALLKGLKISTATDDLGISEKIIPLANGDLEYINGSDFIFHKGVKRHTPYRLPITIDDKWLIGDKDLFYPKNNYLPPTFRNWLHSTFHEEDIPTIQEMFGYSLVPTTKAQEMFVIVGDGGVGKGGVMHILKGLLGNGAYTPIDLGLLLSNEFRLQEIENKLVALEEELSSDKLTNVNLFKKIVTNDGTMKMEKKFKDSYNGKSYCKIICLANTDITTIGEENNEGFFRRIHPISTKLKNPNRRDDPDFYTKLIEYDLGFIFLWALQGYMRLAYFNDFHVTWSDRSKKYLNQMKKQAVNFEDFLEECCTFGEGDVTSVELYFEYQDWCKVNGISAKSKDLLGKFMAKNAEKLGFLTTRVMRNGARLRGYKGISLKYERD